MSVRDILFVKVSIIFVLIAILGLLIGGFYYQSLLYSPTSVENATFSILPGESARLVANRLQAQKLIKSALAFRIYLKLNNLSDNIQAGTYTIPSGATSIDLANLFQHGVSDLKLTFIEGWRLEEFAEYAVKNLPNVTYEGFIQQAQGLEGMLFPDTYYVSTDTTTSGLITLLKETFDDKMIPYLQDARVERTGLKQNELFTLASIIEREVPTDNDRKIVAGILLKRIREGQKLEADATTQYVVGTKGEWWPKDLTQEELANPSPYNTRFNFGLPPAPISSFGTASVEAILDYVDTPYYFYITGNNGIMYYAETLDQHIENINNYL